MDLFLQGFFPLANEPTNFEICVNFVKLAKINRANTIYLNQFNQKSIAWRILYLQIVQFLITSQ